MEDKYGEYKVKIKKAKKDKCTKSKIKSIKKVLKANYDSYIDTDKITKVYSIDVKYRIIGEDDKVTENLSLFLVKYKHIWKIAIGSTPTNMSYNELYGNDDDYFYDDDDDYYY